MKGYINNTKAITKSIANGSIKVTRNDGELVFSGNTYPVKGLLKSELDAKWDSANKAWIVDIDSLRDMQVSLIETITNGTICKFAGYEGTKMVFAWAE